MVGLIVDFSKKRRNILDKMAQPLFKQKRITPKPDGSQEYHTITLNHSFGNEPIIIILFADARCFDPTEKTEVSKPFILAPIRSSDCDPSIIHIFIVDPYVSSIPRP